MARIGKRHPELIGDRCGRCNGSGTVIMDIGGINAQVGCPDCHGTGIVNSPNACKECGGSGTVLVPFIGETKAVATCGHCNGSGLEPASSGPAIREC